MDLRQRIYFNDATEFIL